MPGKRKHVLLSHCTSCGEALNKTTCSIDWHAVYVAKRVKEHMTETGSIPTREELERMDQEVGSCPCDDCCCGSCGSRKVQGDVCC